MVLLWQIYFYRAGGMLGQAIASATAPPTVSELAWYAHLLMVAGIGLSAVGNRHVVVQPLEHTNPAHVLIIFGGPTLFLLGRGILDYAAFSHVSWSRPAGVVALAALVPAALRLPSVATAGLAAAVLVGIATSNVLSWRLFPRTLSPPHR